LSKIILSIAGSDSIAGAGIQQDIKVGQRLQTYVATAISAVTVQNSSTICYFQNLSPKILQDQILTILDDLQIDFIKIGMVACPMQMQKISEIVPKDKKIIIDPIISSTGGSEIIDSKNLSYFKKFLLPRAFLLTPNISEAEKLAGEKIINIKDMTRVAKKIQNMGAANVLIKGAHLTGKIKHLLMGEGEVRSIFQNKRLFLGEEIHGTGCTFSTAIACFLAKGNSLKDATSKANKFTYQQIKNSEKLGKGSLLLPYRIRLDCPT
jgi:hydroxymethylpyrimidine kinase/phosphomethylpyrimidine kinase